MQWHFQVSGERRDLDSLTKASESLLLAGAMQSDLASSQWRLGTTDERAILDAVRIHGFAVLPGFFQADLTVLRNEFERAFRDRPPPYEPLGKEAGMLVAKTDPPTGLAPMYNKTFRRVANRFFDEKFFFNLPVFLHHAMPSERTIIGSHYDDRRNLKFFVYLHDVGIDDGAISFVPGSHEAVAAYLARCDEIGLRARFRPNTVRFVKDKGTWMRLSWHRDPLSPVRPMETRFDKAQLVHICEPAGTVIVFDTNTVHRGGIVAPGHERKIIRGNCRTLAEERRH